MKQSREHGTGQESGGMLFSNQDLRRLIFPLIIEQILAVSVGCLLYTSPSPRDCS